MPTRFITTKKLLLRLLTYGAMFLVVAGCASWPKASPPPKSPSRQHVDVKAQQQYYDLGLQQYSQENYGDAKESFRQAVELGPNTTLGLKAQENLKKIQRILETLEEIESK